MAYPDTSINDPLLLAGAFYYYRFDDVLFYEKRSMKKVKGWAVDMFLQDKVGG